MPDFYGGSLAVVTGASIAAQMGQNEIPGGDIDGSNFTFTTAYAFIPGTLCVYLNGKTLPNPIFLGVTQLAFFTRLDTKSAKENKRFSLRPWRLGGSNAGLLKVLRVAVAGRPDRRFCVSHRRRR